MTRIYYKYWTSNICYREMFVNVESIDVPEDKRDIIITGDEETIHYLNELFGGSISEDEKHLLLAQMPDDIIRYKNIPTTLHK